MRCPFCGYEESKVIDSRPTDENERIRRRRECLRCSKRFTTYEVIEDVPIIVIKKDKSREVFDRNKILKGMLRACEKGLSLSTSLKPLYLRLRLRFSLLSTVRLLRQEQASLLWKSLKILTRLPMFVLRPFIRLLTALRLLGTKFQRCNIMSWGDYLFWQQSPNII